MLQRVVFVDDSRNRDALCRTRFRAAASFGEPKDAAACRISHQRNSPLLYRLTATQLSASWNK